MNLKVSKMKKSYFTILISLLIIGLYYLLIRGFLIPTMSTVTIELVMAGITTGILLFSIVSLLILLLIMGIIALIHRSKSSVKPWGRRVLTKVKLMLTATCFLALLIIISQNTTYTPPIFGEDGKVLKNSIASIEKVNLNGSKQYITIRGENRNNPVLLFLAGGPGGTQLSATREMLTGLEGKFTVVNWDQPGSGKSFGAVPTAQLTPERYVKDGHALTEYLQNRFDQEKIYLVGQSWGSTLGIMMVDDYPEDYHAFIGAGQMVSFLDTEEYCYNLAIELAIENGDANTVKKLNDQGPPPYYGKGITMKSATYLMYLFQEMATNPNINQTDHNTFKDMAGPEYGLIDKVNYFRALISTFDQVYPQLYDVDLREDAINIDVPVYILHGRYDVNAPGALAEDYYNMINAPQKEFIWFEHSGHDLWIDESDLFVDILKDILEQVSNR